jgi:hypothetical protein
MSPMILPILDHTLQSHVKEFNEMVIFLLNVNRASPKKSQVFIFSSCPTIVHNFSRSQYVVL